MINLRFWIDIFVSWILINLISMDFAVFYGKWILRRNSKHCHVLNRKIVTRQVLYRCHLHHAYSHKIIGKRINHNINHHFQPYLVCLILDKNTSNFNIFSWNCVISIYYLFCRWPTTKQCNIGLSIINSHTTSCGWQSVFRARFQYRTNQRYVLCSIFFFQVKKLEWKKIQIKIEESRMNGIN